MTKAPDTTNDSLELWVARAKEGDRAALDHVVSTIQGDINRLAVRFLWHPADAEDAAQEILIRVITSLSSFRGDSRFRTWTYRVACNALLSMKHQRMESRAMSFDQFSDDLAQGLSEESEHAPTAENAMLLEEVKVGCTLAMLLCLDREHRLAYILGEIMELDHNEAVAVLDIPTATYRKRLSRARAGIQSLMMSRCGLVNLANDCRCRKRVRVASSAGRIDPSHLLFASSREQAERFPMVIREIRRLDEGRRAAALYRSHPNSDSSPALTAWLRHFLTQRPELLN